MTQTDFEPYLSFVTLADDGNTILLNDEDRYSARLPMNISRKKAADRQKAIEKTILNTCNSSGVDYVSEDNIKRCAKEVVDLLYEKARVGVGPMSRAAIDYSTTTATAPSSTTTTIELTEELTKEVSWDKISSILSTSIKRDENPKLITFNCMLLAQTHDDQLNLGFQAESSVGKSYIPLDVATYFPESEIQKIASASPTAFYHSGVWDPDRKALIVDLRHKILIFLDMPHFQLLERLRPILSHDDTELHYKITDKSQKYGLKTKDVIILGPPSVCFCSAKTNPDEQEKTRLILLSPSTDEEKLKESLELLTLKKSDSQEYKRRIMKDPQRVWLMKRVMCVRQGGIREVIIPDEGKNVLERFMKEHDHLMPRHQRDYPRIFSFIKAHALLNCFNREKLSEDTILANQTDIDAGFALYKGIEQSNEMGLSPYILKIYDDAFMPILSVNEGVSREDILIQYYKSRHKPMSPEVLRLEIIPQLEAVGLIYQEEGERRKMLVYPTMSHIYNKSMASTASADAACVSDSGVELQKIFWQTYSALENQNQNQENHTVSESALKQRLVSSGKFTAGEAEQAIKASS